MVGLRLEDVGVQYPIYSGGRQRSLLGTLRGKNQRVIVQALRKISFQVQPGERLGLIGHNGAGKTTLLRVLGGMIKPTSGKMTSSGRVLCLLNIQAGFDPERSGYENARFVARMMGLGPKRAKQLVEDVEDFAELGQFMGMPVRTYSAGMGMRLAFGVYTALPHEILVIDEIIGAGDAKFHAKAAARIEATIGRAQILVMATHDPGTLERFCTRGIWLSGGTIVAHGPPMECWRLYAAA